MGKCVNSIVVESTPDAVWTRVKNFHNTGWADGVVTSLEKVGEVPGNKVGARRLVNQAFHETLLSIDEATMTFTYSIDDGPEPVSRATVSKYVGKVKVSVGNKPGTSRVEWGSEFTSSKDQEVASFCNPIYGALLQALKKSFAA